MKIRFSSILLMAAVVTSVDLSSTGFGRAAAQSNSSSDTYVIEIAKDGVRSRMTPEFVGTNNVACQGMKKGMRGLVVATDKKQGAVLVIFDSADWLENCPGRKGIAGLPAAWVSTRHHLFTIAEGVKAEDLAQPLPDSEDSKTEAVAQKCADCGMGQPLSPDNLSTAKSLSASVQSILCEGGYDTRRVEECGFEGIIREARSSGSAAACRRKLEKLACERSMWSNLDLADRFQQIIERGHKIAEGNYNVDPRSLPCIAARETSTLDPLSYARHACTRYSSDRGLGQLTGPTFDDVYHSGFYKAVVPPFNDEYYRKNPRKIFDAMSMNVDLQLELMLATMDRKMSRGRHRNYKIGFRDYHGRIETRKVYSDRVYSCFTCLQERISRDGRKISGKDPLECLDKARSGVRAGFKGYRNSCPMR